MAYIDESLRSKVIKDAGGCCELCGGIKGIEVHHIIPVSLGGSSNIENLICVCRKCHALLTPKSELTKLGINKLKQAKFNCITLYEFYERLNACLQENDSISCSDVLDIVESCIVYEFTEDELNSHKNGS